MELFCWFKATSPREKSRISGWNVRWITLSQSLLTDRNGCVDLGPQVSFCPTKSTSALQKDASIHIGRKQCLWLTLYLCTSNMMQDVKDKKEDEMRAMFETFRHKRLGKIWGFFLFLLLLQKKQKTPNLFRTSWIQWLYPTSSIIHQDYGDGKGPWATTGKLLFELLARTQLFVS